ncbi:MAG: non-canonical purine NTP pyrophosphatase [Brooklawnia sp.]|jgi:XTP/dITP diphosphohydrolase
MKRVLLASNNAKKLAELRRIIAEARLPIEVVGLGDVEPYPEPAETEWTFEGNALIKARAGVRHTGLPTLADDSGLSIDALNQMPGVRSSRWAGPEHDDAANLELVLRQIDDVPHEARTASFVAVLALALPDGREFTTTGQMPGLLAHSRRGTGGFGYDPIFKATEQVRVGERLRTNAELGPSEKDAISHRGKAVRAMLPILRQALTGQEDA